MPIPPVQETSHPWLNYDSQLLTEALYNDNSSKRHGLAVRIRKALRLDQADGFDLVDIGMHNYAVDTSHAPFEFAIVDRQYPEGLEPSQSERSKHVFYDHQRVAGLLTAAGFNGVLVDSNEKRTSAQGRGLLLPAIEKNGSRPWTDTDGAEHLPLGFVFPALLEARTPEPFTLVLPSPIHEHIVLLLRAYGRCLAAFPELVTQAYTWFRSWGTSEFRPLTVALLLAAYMQRSPEIKAPDLQNIPSHMIESVEHTVWMPYRASAGGATVQLPLTVRYAPALPQKATEGPGVLFAGFIGWIKNMKSAYHGSVGRASTKPKHVLHRTVRAVTETKGWGTHASHIMDVKPGKTEPWTWQPLVVVDPFVPTFNRAFDVSRELLESLFDLADGLNTTLSWGSPLSSAFGPRVDVPMYRDILPELDDGEGNEDAPESGIPPTHHTLSRPSSRSSSFTHAHLFGQQTRGSQWPARRFYSSQSSQSKELRSLIDFHGLSTQAPPKLVHERQELVRRIEWAIKKAHGARYTVEVFGSSRYGMDRGDSDLDLVICDPSLPVGFPPDTPKKLPPIYNAWNISKAITSARINVRVDQVIKGAAVPIVKVTDRLTHIRCDICCNDRLGLRNTELLAHYTNILPSLRVVVKALKRWAKPLALNEPSPPAGNPVTFSSYAFTLLAIGLFQTRGILPNLQDVSSSAPGTARIFWARTRSSGPIKCNVGWDPLSLTHTSDTLPSTDQLLLDFFRYYGFQHDYTRDIVSVRERGIVKRWKGIKVEGKRGKEVAARLGVLPLSDVVHDEERWEEVEDAPVKRKDRKDCKDRKGKGRSFDGYEEVKAAAEAEGKSVKAVLEEAEAQAGAVQENDAVVAEGDESVESASEDENEENAERPSSRASTSSNLSQRSRVQWTEKDERLSNIQPDLWRGHALVVADPFIRSKNTAGNIKPDSVLRFRAECQRAYMMLTQHHRAQQEEDSRSDEAMHTVLTPHVDGEDHLPTGPLPPLPERPPPKPRRGNGRAQATQNQQANAEAGPSASQARPFRRSDAEVVPRAVSQQTPVSTSQKSEGTSFPTRSSDLWFEASNVPGSSQTRGRGRPRRGGARGSGARGSGARGGARGRLAVAPPATGTPANAHAA